MGTRGRRIGDCEDRAALVAGCASEAQEGESKVQVIGGILAMRRAAFPDYAQREAR